MREVINAVLYLNRTGCSWRQLPHEFPPWGTVHYYYRCFRLDGTWQKIHDRLRAQVRRKDGRRLLMPQLGTRFRRLRLIFADGGYAGRFVDWTRGRYGRFVEIVKRPTLHRFVVLPKRWIVERTFAWLGKYRRGQWGFAQ